MKTKNGQLELMIAAKSASGSAHSAHVTSTSSWWFARMRQLVDSARDYTTPTPAFRFLVNLSE